MGELLNSGLLSLASLAVSLIVMVVGLVIWFFVNRASSRTNEQIELLEAMLDLQKRQNALLRRLCEANEPEEKAVAKESAADVKDDEDDFIRLVAER
ncbi:YebO family protein [Enterobacter cancerogenus]|uniref:YebO family protein n=1 Tax=Enterobacter TaxID=547 RepID=UPI00249DD68A|nr:YebO family protein [Enterobacter sp. V87_3]MDI3428355.1 YebO family protein [Enterobacter sp. V87_3]